jgi:hypothetical protein
VVVDWACNGVGKGCVIVIVISGTRCGWGWGWPWGRQGLRWAAPGVWVQLCARASDNDDVVANEPVGLYGVPGRAVGGAVKAVGWGPCLRVDGGGGVVDPAGYPLM